MAGKRKEDIEPEVKEAIRAETARGSRRRVADPDVWEERRLRLRTLRELLRMNDRALFLKILTDDYELQVGSEDYNLALQAWNEHHRRTS